MNHPNHATSDYREPEKSDTPSGNQPVLGRKGITIPWAWLSGVAPTAALGGALLHGAVFGAPPEYQTNLEKHGHELESHRVALAEQHEKMALIEQQQSQMLKILEHLQYLLDHPTH